MLKEGLFSRLRSGLARTRQGLADRVKGLVAGRESFDEGLYEELEAVLLQADIGVETTLELLKRLRERVRQEGLREPGEVTDALKREMLGLFQARGASGFAMAPVGPTVIMVVGVNGTGKTTSVGKLAMRLRGEGKKVLLVAADTFRAAATEQLVAWGDRVGADVIRHAAGADPSAVTFDGLQAARARSADVVLVDTAGRLHTKANLMEELKKIKRVIAREVPGAPHEVLLVLDATTGQNAVQQARVFSSALDVTGVLVTKLDGTAKGGFLLGIEYAEALPVKFIGIGENADDLQPFHPAEFIEAIFG